MFPFLIKIAPVMTRHSAVKLLFVLISFFVYLSMSLTDARCPRVAKGSAPCSDEKDKRIMECCLKKYTLGFNNLPDYIPGQDPPSCAVDLGLAKCLSKSRCYGKRLTNGLRLLILNQLVFTKRVNVCKENKFKRVLKKAKKRSDAGFLKDLKKITEMKNMASDDCATRVYAICGRKFKEELEKYPGYNPAELCRVFIREGSCIDDTAHNINCESQILKRFKANSNAAAGVVLNAICPPPPPPNQ